MLESTWYNPTRIYFGSGNLALLGSLIEEQAGKDATVFLVTGKTFLRRHGLLEKILQYCSSTTVHLFDKVVPFPSPALVDQAIKECRKSRANVIVAVGGGSALDLAKVVATLVPQEGFTSDYFTGKKTMMPETLPFIAVPTTSGSSSEVTPFAPLWDMEAPQKFAITGSHMFPAIALVDPDLALTMPKELAAATGMDAFTSAFESYWSTDSHPVSVGINLEVIRLFRDNLVKSCSTDEVLARSNCAYAATMSGVAYSNVRPNVCHALGVPLSLLFGMDHGESVGITLPLILKAFEQHMLDKINPLLQAFRVETFNELIETLVVMMRQCGLKTDFNGMGMDERAIDRMLDYIEWERLGRCPLMFDRQGVKDIYLQLL